MADFVFLAQMDIPTELEGEFNRIYDEQHVPEISTVPGVHGCARYLLEHSSQDGMARYLALYEIDSPDVVTSAEWRAASDKGDWKPQIRPHTTNRVHSIFRKIN